MKKLLILIVFGAVYLHYYPQPKLMGWFNQEKTTFMTSVAEATDTDIRLDSQRILLDLKPRFNQFSEKEIQEIKKLTLNQKSVKDFYLQYCDKNSANPNIQRGNLQLICKTIGKYQALFL